MPVPFDVESQRTPGVNVFGVDEHGNTYLSGDLDVGGELDVVGDLDVGGVITGGSFQTTTGQPVGGPSTEAFAAMIGLKWASADVLTISSGQANAPAYVGNNFNAGVFIAMMCRPGAIAATNLGVWLAATANQPNGINGLALYTEAGVLIDSTTDMGSIWNSGVVPRYVKAPLSAGTHQLAADTNYYFCALAHNNVAPPTVGGNIGLNLPFPVNGHYPCLFLTGQATFPASFTPSAGNTNNGIYFFGID